MTKIVLMIWLILLGILIGGPGKSIYIKYKQWRTKNNQGNKSLSDAVIGQQKDKQTISSDNKENLNKTLTPDIATNIDQKTTTIDVGEIEKISEEKIIEKKEQVTHETKKISTPPTTKPIAEEKIEDSKKTPKELKALKELKMSAITYRERKKWEQYEKKLIEGLALDPDNLEFLEMLSEYYFDTGSFVKAMTLLKKLVNQNSEHHKAIRQIGQVYIQQNDLDTAKILIEKAITIKDDDPKYFISLVDIHYTKNNLNEAIKAMEKILKLRPTSIDYLMSIATLHEENAQPTKAFHYYSKIIELDAMNENAKLGLRRLG